MKRRRFIASSALASAGAAALGTASATDKRKPTFVFVHGAWHGAWCWSDVVTRLASRGYSAVALDLPGHGLAARFPSSYVKRDMAALATELSPLAALSTNDYLDSVVKVLKELVAAGSGPVNLVGHSLGGATLTAVAEAEPKLIRRLVYVSAFVPVTQPAPINYTTMPNFAASELGQLLVADPVKVGALRIDFRTTAPEKALANKNAFCADLDEGRYSAVLPMLSPDEPIGAFITPVNPTVARWGSVPRTYIRCRKDRAIPIFGQDQMIAEADQFSPSNKFVQESLDTGHSPFFSAPEALTDLLVKSTRG